MTPGTELNPQLIHRAYCYLRLSGADGPRALQGMRSAMNVLADAGDAEAVWRELELLTAWVAPIAPDAPPLVRGHLGYGDDGR